ncbi:hypothetical protein [Cobetia sp. 1AS1]|uniref:hypothetical protein n=1 Tax=Pseudomonadota TaxID=1224 RepID=UPI0024483611|nr:hypothetical protein [Cobetia sp. 1AS1]MDH2296025.1 hypothetical protein [Cobetia sp. 1AS1]
MPTNLVSDIDRHVSTKQGHSLNFKAEEPRPVPDVAVQACLTAGCREAGQAKPATPEADAKTDTKADAKTDTKADAKKGGKGPTVGEIAAAMRKIIDEDNADKLTSDGAVRVDAIEAELGQDIPAHLRDAAAKQIEKGEV